MRLWIILITLGALAAAVFRAVILSGRFSRPIEELVGRSDRISRGDLGPSPPIDSMVSEVVRLGEAQDRMRSGLQSLMKLERDLQLARQIQQSTFPATLPELPGFQLAAWSEPAEETGGDTYDVIGIEYGSTAGAPRDRSVRLASGRAERAVLLLADAAGHGIGPALAVTQVRAMLRMAVRTGQPLPSIARHLNEQLAADLPDSRFITAWLGELSSADHTLTSFSAGQGPLLLYRADDDLGHVLPADTVPLGVLDELDELDVAVGAPIRLEPGDIFAVISDGILEAADPEGRLFGVERTMQVIRTRHEASPREILDAIRHAVDAHTVGAPAEDDRTGMIIKRQ
jgi:phosphoserine phosphatase